MKFTLSWLKRHLDTTATLDEISSRLTMLGLEVESIDDPASRLGGFVVGHVLEAEKHPNADRLKLCKVDNGGTILQIVCGAPNARAGLKVILAQPGVVIPVTGEALKKGKVRDIESQGMMCSWRELLIGEDHEGIVELPAETPVGATLTSILDLDPLIDISITPNRADCLGVRGVARDLAASGLGTLKPLPVEAVAGSFESPIKVSLTFPAGDEKACPMFAGRFIRGLKNGESPQWLKDLLSGVGLRPISALVDITNFFTLNVNRPLHVFDAAKLSGNIQARFGREGESFLALNGKNCAVDASMVVIADDAGPLGLGGVMGGEPSGVTETTTDLFLEAALFDPMRIAAAGRKLTLESDARYRFERGVDPAFVIDGLELATRMIIDLCGGEASKLVIAGAPPADARKITFRPHRVAQLGGITVAEEAMIGYLRGLGCLVEKAGEAYSVVPPSWRGDISAEHDLVEEVIRIHGYDHIPTLQMTRPEVTRPVLTPTQKRIIWVRRTLAARSLVETVTWSFIPSAQAKTFGGGQPELVLSNPISADLDCMRPSLLPNLIAASGRNVDRGAKDGSLFEIGPEFPTDTPGAQRNVAAGLRWGRTGPRHWSETPRAVDAFDAKADLLAAIAAAGGVTESSLQVVAEAPSWYHPGRSGSIKLGRTVVAVFGEVHPRLLTEFGVKGPLVGFELYVDALPLPKPKATKAKALLKASPLQSVERDFAFVADRSVASDALVKAAKGADKQFITDVAVFDLYEGPHVGEDKKSLALQVTLQPVEKTFTDVEIEALATKVVEAVTKATGATLRG